MVAEAGQPREHVNAMTLLLLMGGVIALEAQQTVPLVKVLMAMNAFQTPTVGLIKIAQAGTLAVGRSTKGVLEVVTQAQQKIRAQSLCLS